MGTGSICPRKGRDDSTGLGLANLGEICETQIGFEIRTWGDIWNIVLPSRIFSFPNNLAPATRSARLR